MASLCSGVRSLPSTTMVSPVRSDGTRRQCATVSGAALDQARRWKERTYPELAQQHGRARLVVLGCDVGGRWSEESWKFLAPLAAAKAKSEPEPMRKSTMFCSFRRSCTLMACTAAKAFSLSLTERKCWRPQMVPRLQPRWWRTTSGTWSKFEDRRLRCVLHVL